MQELIPESFDFDLIETIIPILTKLEAVSDFMQSETYPTICHVMVKLCFSQMSLKKSIETSPEDSALHKLCSFMTKDLEKRYPKNGSGEKAYAYTHLLHPGQKKVQFCTNRAFSMKLANPCAKMKNLHQ